MPARLAKKGDNGGVRLGEPQVSRYPSRFGLLMLGATLVLPLAPPTAEARSPAEAVAEFRRLLTKLPEPRAVCSAKVVDLSTDTVLVELNADRKLVPASNQKLWVLAAATVELGEVFAFRTVLATRGGEVYVIGDGDPGFGDPRLTEARGDSVTGELERWATLLAAKGFSDLAGHLSYDDTLFDRQWTHPSWESKHQPKWYAAPVSALNLNDNCVDVTIQPAEQPNVPVLWSMVPPNDAVEVVNRCLSAGKGTPVINRPGPQMQIVLSGQCSKRWEFPSVAVSDPVALFAGAFRQALGKQGITTSDEVRTARVRLPNTRLPDNLTVLAEYRTPLPGALARAGKHSQNLFAEALLKRLGFEWSRRTGRAEPIGSWETGRAAVLDFAERAGLSLTEADYHDGSGLARDNRLSAAQAVELLAYMYHHPARDLFAKSLAAPGEDGSLKKRMKDMRGLIYAKTGYLSGVRTLSGYVVTPAGRWLAFSVLFNGIKGDTEPFNKLHDQICRLLADWPTGP
ncbi:MAG: D-alanyl-D-alanine carboxypeptidase/D-alanyl-D-alanine-endopeptidase [Planctomycetota bacterium]